MFDKVSPTKQVVSNHPPAEDERRRHSRHLFTATIEAFDPGTKLRVNARTSDLSRSGFYVDTINPLSVGTCVKVRITKDNKTFDVEARVVYSQVSMGMGLVFTALLPEQSGVIARWIGEATGEVSEGSDTGLDLQEQSEEGTAAAPLKEGQQYVLRDVIVILMREGILNESQGKAMLARLHR